MNQLIQSKKLDILKYCRAHLEFRSYSLEYDHRIVFELRLGDIVWRSETHSGHRDMRYDKEEYDRHMVLQMCHNVLKVYLHSIPIFETYEEDIIKELELESNYLTIASAMSRGKELYVPYEFIRGYMYYKNNPYDLSKWLMKKIYNVEYFKEQYPEIFI